MFRPYHYLNRNLNSSALTFAAYYHEQPVAFIAFIKLPYRKKYWIVSRLVVLPDYQGIGIGTRLLTLAAQRVAATTGLDVSITSSNPQLRALTHNPYWRLTRQGHVHGDRGAFRRLKHFTQSSSTNRLTMSFKYLGNRDVESNAQIISR